MTGALKKAKRVAVFILATLLLLMLAGASFVWYRTHFDSIVLVSVNHALTDSQLDSTQKNLAQWLAIPVKTVQHEAEIQQAYNEERKQYDAGALLKLADLFALDGGLNSYSIVFVDGDIYTDGMSYLFTSSNPLRLRTVVGNARVLNRHEGTEKNALRLSKLLKRRIAIASGLYSSECGPMGFSNSLQELDAKPVEYCKEDETYLRNRGVIK